MKSLERETISVIELQADAIMHTGVSHRGHDLYSFAIGYVKGTTHGRFFVFLVGHGQERFELFMLIHEHDAR